MHHQEHRIPQQVFISITTIMRYSFILAALTALVTATPVALEERQSKPDPSQVYVESKTLASSSTLCSAFLSIYFS
jgi:hypothetical protein